MAITAASNTIEIMADARVTTTASDLAEWNEITDLPTTMALDISTYSLTLAFYVGTFGADLTTIQDNCSTSYDANGGQYCQSNRIGSYDGFAVGMYIATNTPSLAFAETAAGSVMYDASSPFYLCFEYESCIGTLFTPSGTDSTAYVYCGLADDSPDTATAAWTTYTCAYAVTNYSLLHQYGFSETDWFSLRDLDASAAYTASAFTV
jgi:hypothetical protein